MGAQLTGGVDALNVHILSGVIGGSWTGAGHTTARTVAVAIEGGLSTRRQWHLATMVDARNNPQQVRLHVITLEAKQERVCIGRDGFDVGYGGCETYLPDCPRGRNQFSGRRGCTDADTREVSFRLYCRQETAEFACSECATCVDTPLLSLTTVAAYAKTFDRNALEANIDDVDVIERVRLMGWQPYTRVATAAHGCCLGAASVDYHFASVPPAPPIPSPPRPPLQPPTPPLSPRSAVHFPSFVVVHESSAVADARDVVITGGCIGSSTFNPCLRAVASVVTKTPLGGDMRPGNDWVMWYLGAIQGDILQIIWIEVTRSSHNGGAGTAVLIRQRAYYKGVGFSSFDTDTLDINEIMNQPNFRLACPRQVGGLAGSYDDSGAGAAVRPSAPLSNLCRHCARACPDLYEAAPAALPGANVIRVHVLTSTLPPPPPPNASGGRVHYRRLFK